ncbi:MAG TPA: RimK family protein [Gammaproteobacteria bacterium]|nr:RimK family protein [Gammaproteobacteria bacterium]
MSNTIIVVENKTDWHASFPELRVVTAKEYLSGGELQTQRGLKIINLCRGYSYLSVGYYCSLLAEARRHRVLPSVRTMSELSRKSLYSLDASDLDELVHKRLKRSVREHFDLFLYFGRCADERFEEIGRQIFEMFPCPLLYVEFKKDQEWRITRIRPVFLNQLKAAQHEAFAEAMDAQLNRRWRARRAPASARYDLAILYNRDDPLPPSDMKAIRKFERVGKSLGFDIDIIAKKDYARLAEYDALFIRETTRIDHYTYRFARKAESEGMVVIDDPNSILKCTNKVYLAELLRANRVPRPKTVILQKGVTETIDETLSWPVVLKIPDGSFSRGVHKARDMGEFKALTAQLFKESDLILAQEYVYTAFDWRIGILNRRPIFACRYFMSKNHWQIVNHKAGGRFTEGGFETLRVENAPAEVVDAALKAANLIGDGLYGVDIKQHEGKLYVIEVNDNPNIDAGVEDKLLDEDLYRTILLEFAARLDRKRQA